MGTIKIVVCLKKSVWKVEKLLLTEMMLICLIVSQMGCLLDLVDNVQSINKDVVLKVLKERIACLLNAQKLG